ncbi:MAG: acetate kinase [Deltaproteobacteria bacterium]|jgi:acetate kinase|nr:acetate kinase [Deltaproteobacteria bacterium]
MNILVINCGSSSFKYQLINMDNELVLSSGLVERIGEANGLLTHKVAPGSDGERKFQLGRSFPDHAAGMNAVMDLLVDPEKGVLASLKDINAVGHRVVMGGEAIRASCLMGDREKKIVAELSALAPLHNPANLQGIEVAQALLPHAPSVGVFDTEFHATLPPMAFMYALPYSLYEQQRIRRYGFHGTSHRFVARAGARLLGKNPEAFNAITCHLGNGCSITAVRNGRSVETSMGLTPLEGVVMGTRSGNIDPAILLFLGRGQNMDFAALDAMLNKDSGLKGICGLNDMRDIHEARAGGDEKAQLAFDIFCHGIRKYIGAYCAVLGRLDALIFTAGIGENDDLARAAICADLEILGLSIDQAKNARRSSGPRAISRDNSPVPVLVVPTNEELAIAQETVAVLSGKK